MYFSQKIIIVWAHLTLRQTKKKNFCLTNASESIQKTFSFHNNMRWHMNQSLSHSMTSLETTVATSSIENSSEQVVKTSVTLIKRRKNHKQEKNSEF